MSDWEPAVITGGLAMLTAVFLAVWNHREQTRAAHLEDTREKKREKRMANHEIAMDDLVRRANDASAKEAAEDAALRSYRFDARKRLYTDVNPLVFQLRELCRGSSNRARRIVCGDTDVNAGHLHTTTQRLFAPLVVVQEIQRHLTAVDLRLDATLSAQYAVARELLWTFHSGVAIAATAPRIAYGPTQDSSDPRQHLTHAQLLRLVDVLTVADEDGVRRPIKQTELDDRMAADDTDVSGALRRVEKLFSSASPVQTPVLWRLLLAYAMFLYIFADLVDRDTATAVAIVPPDFDNFSWPAEPGVFTQERDAAERFVRERLEAAGVAIAR